MVRTFDLYCIAFGIVSDIECLHKIIFTLGSVFQSFWKKIIFSKNVTFLILDGCLSNCTKVYILR